MREAGGDTEAVIALDGAGEVELTGQTMVIDPYSEFAVERAVQLKEELGGTVTLLTLGSQDCLAAVRHGLAWVPMRPCSSRTTSGRPRRRPGRPARRGGLTMAPTSSGRLEVRRHGGGQVMGRMAAIMGLPLANMATGLSVEGDAIVAECEVDDGVETARLPLPAVVAAQQAG
ncbi:MAG: electron transfer flavoprotein subunit beta/FixA family protein [Adlercreutzia equolifaciens]